VLDAPPESASKVDSQQRRDNVAQIAREGGGSQYTGTTQFSVARTLRTDRVLIAVGLAAAVAGAIVLRRSRR
jgi:hypothetical protein